MRLITYVEQLERNWENLKIKINDEDKWKEFLRDVEELEKLAMAGKSKELSRKFEAFFNKWDIQSDVILRSLDTPDTIVIEDTSMIANRLRSLIEKEVRSEDGKSKQN